MPKIDIGAVLAEKAPGLSRWIPRWVVSWLRRVVHEEQVNQIIERYWDLPPRDFIRAFFDYMRIDYSSEGLEALDPDGRYLFASNHPFGGMDGLMLADELIGRFGDVRVVVNDLLMHVEPLRPLWIPVNKHGRQGVEQALRFEQAFRSDLPILTFPAGLCSRRIKGTVTDLEWKTNFVKRALKSDRSVVPVFVEGALSDFFYRLSNLRRMAGVGFNIEMLWLSDEMFAQQGRSFRIRFGEPIPPERLERAGNLRAQTEYVRRKTYFLRDRLLGGGSLKEKG